MGGDGVSDTPTKTAPVSPDRETHTGSGYAPAPLRIRDRDRYEMIAEHGRGGLGVVHRGHDRELGRDVAVKELLDRGDGAELRFFREALVTARLEHPGIVAVHEAGRWADGTPFYTMKLVGGRSLKERLDEQDALKDRLAFLPNVIAVADAMAYAHERRIIHRDLKPSNIMVGDFGETIVIDWGLAKQVHEVAAEPMDDDPFRSPAHSELTAAGTVLGTPAYMAPEQRRGTADHRSDIYALGGILYHLLAGRPPNGEPDVTTNVGRGTPADLIAIARRAMAPKPDDRYATASAFAEELRRFSRRERVSARRYSVVARLALAFARHRTVALVLVAALAVLTVTFAVSLFNVAHERSEAIEARETAVIANAAAQLERDPTRAWQILESVLRHESTALLRARIQAAGVADRVIELPARFDIAELVPDRDRTIIALADRTLRAVDPRSGAMALLASHLTEPVQWASSADRVYFVRQTPHLAIATTPVSGGPVIELARVTKVPDMMEANSNGTYWLASDGTVTHAAIGSRATVIARDVARFQLVGSRIAICGRDGVLSIGVPGERGEASGNCEDRPTWNVIPEGRAVLSNDKLSVETASQSRTVDASGDYRLRFLRLTHTGLVAALGVDGSGLLLRPGADAFERATISGKPAEVVARGSVVAWSFLDGRLEVLDTADGRQWSVQAHPESIYCVGFVADHQLMTCGRKQIRIWTLPRAASEVVAAIPTRSNTIVFNRAGDALLDGNDGNAYLIRHGDKRAVAIHRHDLFAFGAAWCGSQACSAGWDGRVRCTDLEGNTTRVVADLHSVPTSLAAGSGHCFMSAATGAVYELQSPATPIYEHRHEPYEVAVSSDGRYVASGDWEGDLRVFDTRSRQVIAMLDAAHVGLISSVRWNGEYLVTAGTDGHLRIFTPGLGPIASRQFGVPVRRLDANGGSIAIALDDGSLWMLSMRGDVLARVESGASIVSVAVASDGERFAAGTSDGDVIVVAADGRVAAARFERGLVPCLSFESRDALMVCTPSGRLMRLHLAGMAF